MIIIPLYIQNEKGEKIFLGFPEQNTQTSGQQYDEHCILDRICSRLKRIPPQFILGYYQQDSYGNEIFVKNEHHYSNLNEEEKEKLFNECMSNMDNISMNFNNLINSLNFEQLYQIKKNMEKTGWHSYMVDNAILLAKKHQEQISSKNKETKIDNQNTIQKNETQQGRNIIFPNSTSIKNEISKLRNIRRQIIMSKVNNEEEEKQQDTETTHKK